MKRLFKYQVLLLLFVGNFCFSKTNQDSLMGIWNDESIHDTVRLKAIEKCVNQLIYSLPDSAYKLGKLQLEKAKQINHYQLEISALGNMGITRAITQNHEEALNLFYRQLSLAEINNDKQRAINAINNIGIVYNMQNNYHKAIDLYKKSLNMAVEIKDSVAIANALNNLGNVYNNIGQIDEAFDYHKQCLLIRRLINNKVGLAHSYINLSNILSNKGEIEQSREYAYQALNLKRELNDAHGESTALLALAHCFYLSENYDEAEKYFKEGAEISKTIGNKTFYSTALSKLGLTKHYQGDNLNAEKYCIEAYEVSKEINHKKTLREACSCLQIVYSRAEDYEKAFKYLAELKTLDDEIAQETKTTEIIQHEMKLEYEKEKEVSAKTHELELERQKQLASSQKKQQQTIIFFISVLLCLILVFSVFIYRRFKLTKNQKQIIELQKVEVEEKNKEIIDSINYSKRLQESILPSNKQVDRVLKEAFVFYQPKDIVAGDFYWVEKKGNNVFFAVADCTGHGVPGALLSVVCSNLISKVVKELNIIKPALILDKVSELLEERFSESDEDIKDGMDISICVLNTDTLELQYAGANNPIYIIKQSLINEIKPDKQPIGKYDHRKPFSNHIIMMERGDLIYLFTDGFADQFGGEKGKKYKYSNFRELLIKTSDLDIHQQKQTIANTFNDWKKGYEQIDDVCIMGVKI
jgi:serine phosphatase RsbU (regulator of sigma subunit)